MVIFSLIRLVLWSRYKNSTRSVIQPPLSTPVDLQPRPYWRGFAFGVRMLQANSTLQTLQRNDDVYHDASAKPSLDFRGKSPLTNRE
jgi:hypothetical protein